MLSVEISWVFMQHMHLLSESNTKLMSQKKRRS